MTENAPTILLVEDSEDDAELATHALERAGLDGSVRVVRDGEAAADYLFGTSAEGVRNDVPYLVLMDIKLPKIDGFQLLARVRDDPRTQTVPIVILSSSDIEEDIARAYALGANSYVRKPVEFVEYSEVVRRVGHYWMHINYTRVGRAT